VGPDPRRGRRGRADHWSARNRAAQIAGRYSMGHHPPFLLADVAEHLDDFTGAAPESQVFTGPKGAQLRRSNFTRIWRAALDAAGLVGIHFHDLRHTGNTLAGEAGASPRELMDRMGPQLDPGRLHLPAPHVAARQNDR